MSVELVTLVRELAGGGNISVKRGEREREKVEKPWALARTLGAS